MKSQILIALMISLTLLSCDSRKPIDKEPVTSNDLTTGKDLSERIITKPEGLSCNDIWISIDEERTDRIIFYYGETFYLNFKNPEGFNRADGNVFPGMVLKVTDEKGDTIIQTKDEYADSVNGINLSPLLIKTTFNVVKPVHSNHRYTLSVKIWDKLGQGTFITEMPFSVIKDERINIETSYISYDEIYLYSSDRDKVITDGFIYFNETIYIILEGLSGFYETNGKVFPGSAVQAIDNSNTPIMSYSDLFYLYTKTGINAEDFKEQIYLKMTFAEGTLANPILCEAIIFDKKRNAANIKVTTELNVK